jgi:transposase-like protein
LQPFSRCAKNSAWGEVFGGKNFGAKYPKAIERLMRGRDELLAFYNFPAQHWQNIRTSNPIESALATIRNRTKRTKAV